jgi:hypothetical protein
MGVIEGASMTHLLGLIRRAPQSVHLGTINATACSQRKSRSQRWADGNVSRTFTTITDRR